MKPYNAQVTSASQLSALVSHLPHNPYLSRAVSVGEIDVEQRMNYRGSEEVVRTQHNDREA